MKLSGHHSASNFIEQSPTHDARQDTATVANQSADRKVILIIFWQSQNVAGACGITQASATCWASVKILSKSPFYQLIDLQQ